MGKYYQRKEYQKKEWGGYRGFSCSDPILLEVVLEEGDTSERIIKRFLKKFKKLRLMDEIKSHEYYQKPSTIRREKKKRSMAKIKKLQEERDAKEGY